MNETRAPFPWFGGKRRVADVVWRAFGAETPNYVEPFFGSGAVMLGRPGGAGKIETANDVDRYVANFFRAVIADPWGVAEWADYPVIEADMHARHKWLVNRAEFRERMHTDPDFYDVKIAGWWVWGLCIWIGGGWCVEPQNHKHPKLDGIGKGVHSNAGHAREKEVRARTRPKIDGNHAGMGVHSEGAHARTRGANRLDEASRPELAGAGRGIKSGRGRRQSEADWRKRPALDGTHSGRGVHSDEPHLSQQIPQLRVTDGASGSGVHASGMLAEAYSAGRRHALSSAGQGVHLPSLGNDRGVHGVSTAPGTWLNALHALQVPEAPPCFEWFQRLMLRLRRVRFANGDWKRVLGDSVLGKGKNVGGRRPCAVFLDPPYSHEVRDPYLYSEDDAAISALVREWALEHGDDPDLRIALCGYEGEHEMPASWTVHAWKAARGYAKESNENRSRERIWFSPHCLPIETQRSLFADAGASP
ncbi:MAG TPA: DNA adenine methylase [Polyangiaceae bacterium]|nr:DNA adenine methylase [Polyangiaceae bacterium]